MSSWQHKRRVMQRYDLTADMYDDRYAREQEAKFHAVFGESNTVGPTLDIGCGTGLIFRHLRSRVAIVVGIDISKGLLLKAKERASKYNVDLVQADADNLPFKNGEFNTVFAFTILQNMPKPLKTLTEMKRIAKCGSVVTVTALKKAFSLIEFEKLFRRIGFHVTEIKDYADLKCYIVSGLKQGLD